MFWDQIEQISCCFNHQQDSNKDIGELKNVCEGWTGVSSLSAVKLSLLLRPGIRGNLNVLGGTFLGRGVRNDPKRNLACSTQVL